MLLKEERRKDWKRIYAVEGGATCGCEYPQNVSQALIGLENYAFSGFFFFFGGGNFRSNSCKYSVCDYRFWLGIDIFCEKKWQIFDKKIKYIKLNKSP